MIPARLMLIVPVTETVSQILMLCMVILVATFLVGYLLLKAIHSIKKRKKMPKTPSLLERRKAKMPLKLRDATRCSKPLELILNSTLLGSSTQQILTSQTVMESLQTVSPDSPLKKTFFESKTTSLNFSSKQETYINRDSTISSYKDSPLKSCSKPMSFISHKTTALDFQDSVVNDFGLKSVMNIYEESLREVSLEAQRTKSLSNKSMPTLKGLRIIMEHNEVIDDQRGEEVISEISLEQPAEEISEIGGISPEKRLPSVSFSFHPSAFAVNSPVK